MAGLEDCVAALGWDADTVVFHVEPARELTDRHRHALSTVFDAVSDEVLDELLEPASVGDDRRRQLCLEFSAGRFDGPPAVGDERIQGHRFQFTDVVAPSGECEQILDEVVDAV